MTTINRLEELMSAATPGPWRVRENARNSPDECDLSVCGDIWVLADINGPQYPHQEANAALIVEAVNALPDLLATIARLESENAELRAWRDAFLDANESWQARALAAEKRVSEIADAVDGPFASDRARHNALAAVQRLTKETTNGK